jgi:hypothetical protein
MDQMLTQMLVEKLGVPKEVYDNLQKGDLSTSISSLFPDPQMAMLVNSMLGQITTENETSEQRVDPERALANARQTIRELREDLEDADTMLHYFAEMFGVCPFCLGWGKQCLHCKGRGVLEDTFPNEEELLAWVKPALKKLGLRVVKLGSV